MPQTPGRIPRSLTVLPLLALLAPVLAQNGDRQGEEQPPLPADLEVPPAPVLSPEEALASFTVEPGFRVELVAAEPLVVDPVAAAFDARGRLWVCEMRGYMPDADGRGEREPVGEVAFLEDLDGDGRMDRRTVFVDGLVLPRALAPVADGVLVIEPPDLAFHRDTDGDGRADERIVVDTGLPGLENPEHAINGLLPTLDNWLHCANRGVRYRLRDGEWQRGSTGGGGQWGLTQDDLGRVLYNTNSDPLRGDAWPSAYLVRNAHLGGAVGGNERFVHDFTVWPGRINPGVNRGYQPATLRDDFTLHRFTGACGPHVYRGSLFPAEFRGNAFVCEPTGNLVKRYALREDERGRLVGENVHEGREFLTSTDERFRPVNLLGGPDGGLYVLDMYRGLVQHRIYLTTFLRRQIEERGLEGPMGLGRVWRIVPEDAEARPRPDLADASWSEIALLLGDPDGWWRDAAQRIVVEEGRGDRDAEELVRRAARGHASPLGRMHALWALEGIDGLDPGLLAEALEDEDPRVRLAAVRAGESWLATGRAELVEAVAAIERETAWKHLEVQCLLSLGESRSAAGDRALHEALTRDGSTRTRREAVLSGLEQREHAFLLALLEDPRWREPAEGRHEFLVALARCIARSGRSDHIDEVVHRASLDAEALPWRAAALIEGLLAARPKDPRGEPGRLRLASAPAALERLTGCADETVAARAVELDGALAWPGRPGIEEEPVRPLEPAEQARFERGREIYGAVCSACHGPSGLGDPGKAPPLRHSPWVLGSERRLVTILLHGLVGPIELDGGRWEMEMPAFGASDSDLAAVATYVRREWGHGAEPVEPDTVAAEREARSTRTGPWTVEQLERVEW